MRNYQIIKSGVSDHDCTTPSVRFHLEKKTKGRLYNNQKSAAPMSRNYNKMNKDHFLKDLANKPWALINNSVPLDSAVDLLTSFITESLDKHAPLCKRPSKRRKKTMFSVELRHLQRERDRVKKEMMKADGTIDQSIFQTYKHLRNKCTSRARQEKRLEIAKSLEADPSSANIWRVVKSEKEHTESKKTLPSNLTADDLNLYFTTKIERLQEKIDPSLVKDPCVKLQTKLSGRNLKFSFHRVSMRSVKKIVKKM